MEDFYLQLSQYLGPISLILFFIAGIFLYLRTKTKSTLFFCIGISMVLLSYILQSIIPSSIIEVTLTGEIVSKTESTNVSFAWAFLSLFGGLVSALSLLFFSYKHTNNDKNT